MNIRWIPKFAIFLALLACGLAACTGEQPRLIGAYPSQAEPKPLVELPRSAPLAGAQFVYETWITLDVSQVTSTAERAVDLAARRGGYLESSHTWLQDGRTYMTLVLATPAAGFEDLREDLLSLGSLQNEQVTGEWISTHNSWASYSHITLTLQPRVLAWPDWPELGWNPGRTFGQALEVFWSIFGFLVDILIWTVVVLGPFVLIALGLRALWRRVR